MDTITHGLTGALVGKGFFAERHGRVATFAATLGAVFPDSDVVTELFSHNDLAVVELHRGFTHSFVCLPLFAVGLAALTRWYARRRAIDCPSWPVLAIIYAAGLANHILLDMITSFGTMIFSPLSNVRVAWDLVFIIDFVFTGIVLLPQVAAWVYRRPGGRTPRAVWMWVLLSLCAAAIFMLERAVGFSFPPWAVVAASLLLAVLFFLPAWRGWGLRRPRACWCRAGVSALAGYLGLCGVAHHTALRHTETFAAARKLGVDRIGALPLPPSLIHWVGLVRTPDGVYQEFFNVLKPGRSVVHFFADAPPNGYIATAKQLPAVKIYLWFARFPVVHYAQQGNWHIVEFTDLRFFTRGVRRRHPFTFRVILNSAGGVVEEGWMQD